MSSAQRPGEGPPGVPAPLVAARWGLAVGRSNRAIKGPRKPRCHGVEASASLSWHRSARSSVLAAIQFEFPVSCFPELCRRRRLYIKIIWSGNKKHSTTFSFHPECVALFTFRLAFCGPSFSDGRLGGVSISHKESKLQAFPISHFPFPPNII